MASITYRDPELDESFSFSSCYDFNSSLPAIFSGNDESDDESYIEIALEPTDHANDDNDEEMELRISFSSGVSHSITKPKTRKHDEFVVTTSVPSSPSTFTMGSSSSSSSATENDQRESRTGSKTTNKASSTSGVQKTIKRRVQFPTVSSFIDTLKAGLRASSEVDDENGRPANNNHLVLVRSSTRNATTTTTTTTNNGISDQKINHGIMMKFLIKFRALKIRTLAASFMKSCQEMNSPDKRNIGTYQRLMKKPFDKLLLQKEGAERPRVLEMNLDAIRGVLEAVRSSLGRKDRKCKGSCPTSTKSSPIHDGYHQNNKMCATDNSIQAAIAHCKRSFGPNGA